jgi:hypothetical protein
MLPSDDHSVLDPARIGITLSEEFQLDPEQSTSAIIAHLPEARYVNVRNAATNPQLALRIGESSYRLICGCASDQSRDSPRRSA